MPVYRIIGSLAGGATPEEVCEEYGIIDADVRAALEYAEELVEAEKKLILYLRPKSVCNSSHQ